MLSSSCARRFAIPLVLIGSLITLPSFAQQAQTPAAPPKATLPSPESHPAQSPGPPALLDPAGPTVSMETSEALFDVAVALNTCGYDKGLDESDPVRKRVRDEVNEATAASAEARDARDKLCLYIDRRRIEDPAHQLAQYVSLALFLTPPPELTPTVDQEDLPPDASGVELILPLLRGFARAINLHVIWVENRPAYEAIVNRLHNPLTNMIVGTNYYLKVPASTYSGRRFIVVVEPMLSPEETNARVYGSEYVVVASPQNGQIRMNLVRHAYLHYQIEPLLYSRANDMERMMPILKTVQDAPLSFTFKSDIVALVIESMIRAIEARTMDTGIQEVKIPPYTPRSELDQYTRARNLSLQKIAAVRQAAVNHSMAQGFVLTQYFYSQMAAFEKNPESLDEAIGPMVYGMDISVETHRAKQVAFDTQGEGDVLSHAPAAPKGLDLAEMKLMKGDVTGATAMAQKALDDHSGDPSRADFILARADLLNGKVQDAVKAFNNTLASSKDPRTVAWSHIYLGRIHDVSDEREEAIAEYKAALTARDGQPDTKQAAEQGLKQPFALPTQAHSDSDQDGAQDGSQNPPAHGTPQGNQPAAPAPQ
jgi:hypothetical protein